MTLLADKLKQLPQDSGVYLMKDQKGTIIYVGKAKNLKNRVSSYFQSGGQHTHKTRALVSEITDFDLMLTKTEIEALLLERTLIRHHMPRFNILLRDDKEYPYLRVHFSDYRTLRQLIAPIHADEAGLPNFSADSLFTP
jgi:excinuclease ABC subunit C